MNKKLIYSSIGLCLSGLALSQSAWAGNDQSNKKCPFNASTEGVVVLTREFSNFHYVAGDINNTHDDSYQLCRDAGFTNCADSVPHNTNGSGLRIFGNSRSNHIEGSPYRDEICGNNGSDLIDGNEGDDDIYGNNGSDHLYGSLGSDHLYGGNGSDYLYGDLGNDDLFGGNGSDHLWGYDDENAALSDSLLDDSDSDEDWLEGGNSKDYLWGGPDDDTLSGGNGKDDLNGNDGFDDIQGGKGKDGCTDDDDNHDDDHSDAEDDSECSVTETEDEHGPNHT